MEQLIENVGEGWLEREAPKPDRPEHPLAQLIRVARATPSHDRLNNEQFLLLTRIAFDLDVLRRASVAGTEEKVLGLTASSEEKVYSSAHEVRVASHYVRLGHHVSFVPEAARRTPDLLIDNEVEVECKHKAKETATDRQRYELYGILRRRIGMTLKAAGSAPGVDVEVTFRTEPNRGVVDEVVKVTRSAVLPGGSYAFVRTDGDCSYRVLAHQSLPRKGVALVIPDTLASEYDLVVSEGVVVEDETGNHGVGRRLTLAVKCEILQDRVKGLKKSLEKAADQFSKSRPAIIHVDISSFRHSTLDDRLPRGQSVIEETFRNNSRVSAIVLERDGFHRAGDRLVLSRSLETIVSSFARRPLTGRLRQELLSEG